MSLKNCITKLGKALDAGDRQAIEAMVADGMSEAEAVQSKLDELNTEVEQVAFAAQQAGGEVLFQFAGEKSAAANLGQLEKAKALEGKASPETIRRNTGWFKGSDNKWRYEISDDQAKFLIDLPTQEKQVTLSDLLSHDKLYAAYPDIADIQVLFADMPSQNNGEYIINQDAIAINTNMTEEDALSTLLHEVQHAIQERENFARGGSVDAAFAEAVKRALGELKKGKQSEVENWKWKNKWKLVSEEKTAEMAQSALIWKSSQKLIDYSNNERPSSVFSHIRNQFQWVYSERILKDKNLRERANHLERRFYEIPKRGKKRNEFIRSLSFDIAQVLRDAIPSDQVKLFKSDSRTIDSVIRSLEKEAKKSRERVAPLEKLNREAKQAKEVAEASDFKSPYQIYKALAGEVEARTTEKRRPLTEEQRKGRPPVMDMDTPTSEAIVIFGGMEIESPNTMMSQGKPKQPRGYYDPGNRRITITPKADLSTFLHETSHWYLETLRELSVGSQDLAKDVDILTDWAVSQGAKTDTDIHEMFASGMETYFMEGKAPTPELQPLYSRFKAWLTLVYAQLKNVFARNNLEGVQLSDEVRAVMDRTMATQDAIDAARLQMNYGPHNFERMGVDPTTAEKLQALHAEAMAEEEAKLQVEVMKEMQRERADWWRKEHKELSAEIEQELAQQTEYQARDYLSGDVIPEGLEAAKLDTKYIGEVYGKEARSKLNRMSSKTGDHPDVIAPLFGYQSGDALVEALLSTMNKADRKKFADAQATEQMRKTHGDMLNDGSMPDQAIEAVHSDKRADILLAELRWLNKTTGKTQTPRAVFKARAENSMASMPIDKIRPDLYRRNEIKARNAAVKAAATGEYETAAIEQARAVQQFYLYREANKSKDKAAGHQRRLNQIKKAKYSPRKYHQDYIQQVKVLVAAYDLRKSPRDSNALLDRVNSFIQAQAEVNPDLIAGDLLANIESWKSLTLDELQAVRDAAENLLHQGRQLSEEMQEEFRQQADEIAANVRDKTKNPKEQSDSTSMIAMAKKGKEQFSAIHRKLESLLQEAEGWEDSGPLQQAVFRSLWDAQIAELERIGSENERMNGLFENFNYLFNGFKDNLKDIATTQKYVDLYTMRVGTPETGFRTRKMTRGERLVLALNWGNEGNREAIRNQEGREMSDAEVMSAIQTLTAEELELVNSIWEYVDSFYPELAAVEQQATGIAPAKVEASPFVVNGVEMRGGYYPLQADNSLNWKAEMHAVEERAQKLLQGGGAMRASTKHGSTIERQGFGSQPVNLDISGLFRHVHGVVHDITHRQAVINADRLMRNTGVRDAVAESIGREHYNAINSAITRLAAGNSHPSELAILDKMMRWSRVATSYGAMGYSVRTAMINVTGLVPAIPEVGARPLASALMQEISGIVHDIPRKAERWSKFKAAGASDYAASIMEKSVMMENRAQTIERDIYETLRNLKGNSAWNNFKAYAFWMIGQVDGFVSRAVWSAAYNNAIQAGANEADAVFAADRTVMRTQGGGLKIDLSAVEDQNEIVKALTPMYSYFNAVLNLSKRQTGKLKTGQMSKKDYALAMGAIFMLVPVLEWVMFGDAEDDPAETLPKEMAGYYLGQWFGIRELSGWVKYGRHFETPLQKTLSAVPAAGVTSLQLVFDDDKEFDKAALRAYTSALPVMGFPTGVQVNRTIGYLMDLEESGEDLSPYKLLVTGKQDDTVLESFLDND